MTLPAELEAYCVVDLRGLKVKDWCAEQGYLVGQMLERTKRPFVTCGGPPLTNARMVWRPLHDLAGETFDQSPDF